MDTCQLYIENALMASADIQIIDAYSMLFEAEDEQVVNTEKMNNAAAEKSKNFFQKAIEAIKRGIQRLRDMLRDFVDRLKLKGDEKDEFEKFCEEMKNNPEFKNKKITVRDWRKIEKDYNSIVKDIEREIENVKRTNEATKPNIMKHLEERVEGFAPAAKAAAVQVVLGQLEQRAKWDQEFAKKMDFGLKNDFGALNSFLERTVGEKDAQAFKKKSEAYASEVSLRRLLVNLRQHFMSVEKQARIEEKEQKRALMNSLRKSTKYLPADAKKDAVKAGMSAVGHGVGSTVNDAKRLASQKAQMRSLNRQDRANEKLAAREERRRQVKQANLDRRRRVNEAKKAMKNN